MKIDGSCHCGKITYEAEIDPAKVMVCHCTDCQSLSGSAFRVIVFSNPDAFNILSGEVKIYVKTGDSGAERPQAFCPECGSPIYSTDTGDGPKVYGIRAGTIRQRAELAPRAQIWCRSQQPWIDALPGIRKIDAQRVAASEDGVARGNP